LLPTALSPALLPSNSKVLPKDYGNIKNYILLWGLVFAVAIFPANTSFFLQILKRFKEITMAFVISAAVTLCLTPLLLNGIGATGSIVALGASEAVLGISCWVFLKRYLKMIRQEPVLKHGT